MFGKYTSGKVFHAGAVTLISRQTEVVGDIHFSGNLEIEGKIKGNIVAIPGVEACLSVLQHGIVEGDVCVASVIINGEVRGNIIATGQLQLAAKAHIDGNVEYHLIEIMKGARVTGKMLFMADPGLPSTLDLASSVDSNT